MIGIFSGGGVMNGKIFDEVCMGGDVVGKGVGVLKVGGEGVGNFEGVGDEF